jgi:TolA-binding protein
MCNVTTRRKFWISSALLLTVLLFGFSARAELDDSDTEFLFLTELVDYGFADFAEIRLREVENRYPAEKDRIQMTKAQILIGRRKFDEAEKIAAAMPAGNPKADAIKLSLANALSRIGQTDRADKIYNAFFDKYKTKPPTDVDLLRFYQESAYRLVQMREGAGDFAGAAAAYELLLKTKPPEDVYRRVQIELAEIYMKAAEKSSGEAREKNLKKAEKTAADIRWGKYDIWFGRSIPITAMAQVMRGDRAAAQKLIKDYMKDLKAIDKTLKDSGIDRSLSPMAAARYLRGKLYQEDYEMAKAGGDVDQAKKLLSQALTEYANVFGKYGNSDWGPDAGLRLNRLKEDAKSLGKVSQEGGDPNKVAKVSPAVFKGALNLYRQKDYPAAIKTYLEIINEYPDSDESIKALSNVMRSYEKTGQHLLVKVIADYLAGRFPHNDYAAMGVLSMGSTYYKQEKPEEYFWFYDKYVNNFKGHEKVPQILFTLAGLSTKQGNAERESQYLDTLIRDHPKSQYSNKAVSKQAFDLYARGQHAEAAPALEQYIKIALPGLRQAQARLALADSYKHTDQPTKALRIYNNLVKALTPTENNPFRGTLDEEKVLEVLEKASFFLGLTLQQLKVTETQLKPVREKAMSSYQEFIKSFPTSALAPTAMRGIGTLQLELGQTEAAAATFNGIAEKYPESPEGKDAFFLLVDSLIEIGRDQEAREAFAKMIASGSEYSPPQFARIGQLMLDRKFYVEAMQAFKGASVGSEDPAVEQRVLYGLGESMFYNEDYAGAAENLDKLLTKYENTSMFYPGKFLLAASYRKQEMYDKAAEPLNDIFKYSEDAWRRNKASVELGLLQEASGDLNAGLASFYRIMLLGNTSDAKSRPFIQKGLLEGIRISQEMEDFEKTAEFLENYLEAFPQDEKVAELRKLRNKINLRLQTAQ